MQQLSDLINANGWFFALMIPLLFIWVSIRFLRSEDHYYRLVSTNDKKPIDAKAYLALIKEATGSTKRILGTILGIYTYCIATVLTLSSEDVLSQNEITLPLINMQVPFRGFFFITPPFLIFLYGYFFLFLRQLTGLIDTLEGSKRKEITPWIVTQEYNAEWQRANFRSAIVDLSIFYSLPLALFVLSFGSLVLQNGFLSYWQIGWFAASVILAIIFRIKHYSHRKWPEQAPSSERRPWYRARKWVVWLLKRSRRFLKPNKRLVKCTGWLLKPVKRLVKYTKWRLKRTNWMTFPKLIFPFLIIVNVIVLLRYEVMTERNWITRIIFLDHSRFTETSDRTPQIQASGQSLKWANFQYSVINGFTCEKCDLRHVDFRFARILNGRFIDSDLRNSTFEGGACINCLFEESQLDEVVFTGSVLSGSIFQESDLDDVFFNGTNLDSVELSLDQAIRAKTFHSSINLDSALESRLYALKDSLFFMVSD